MVNFDDFSPLRPPPLGTKSKIGHGNVFKQYLEALDPGGNRASNSNRVAEIVFGRWKIEKSQIFGFWPDLALIGILRSPIGDFG